jgi:uncharacterized paraquat-inducible protein A
LFGHNLEPLFSLEFSSRLHLFYHFRLVHFYLLNDIYRIDIDKFGKSYVSYWWLIIGIPITLFGLGLIWQSFSPTRYYCANCGQYLGFESSTCPRCGCNRYTNKDKGIGDTYRRGPYNL